MGILSSRVAGLFETLSSKICRGSVSFKTRTQWKAGLLQPGVSVFRCAFVVGVLLVQDMMTNVDIVTHIYSGHILSGLMSVVTISSNWEVWYVMDNFCLCIWVVVFMAWCWGCRYLVLYLRCSLYGALVRTFRILPPWLLAPCKTMSQKCDTWPMPGWSHHPFRQAMKNRSEWRHKWEFLGMPRIYLQS